MNVCKLCLLILCVNAMQWISHAPELFTDSTKHAKTAAVEAECPQAMEKLEQSTRVVAVLIKEFGLLAALIQSQEVKLF